MTKSLNLLSANKNLLYGMVHVFLFPPTPIYTYPTIHACTQNAELDAEMKRIQDRFHHTNLSMRQGSSHPHLGKTLVSEGFRNFTKCEHSGILGSFHCATYLLARHPGLEPGHFPEMASRHRCTFFFFFFFLRNIEI